MSKFEIETIWPEWELQGKIGSGEFGDVYLAKSVIDGKDAYTAIKVIDVPASAEAVENVRKNGISDDLLKTYFGKFKNDLLWELTMYRPIAGENLAAVEDVTAIDKEGPGWTGYIRTGVYYPLAEYFEKSPADGELAAHIGADVCAALEKCEKHNVTHGEIKPENVMVSDAGAFVVTDFGVRRCLEKAGLFADGDDAFEAPELREDKRHTAASDIYSLGMLMCYVAAGAMMPPNGNPDYIEGVDPDLAAIIKKATAAVPTERYASAADMRADIENLTIGKAPLRKTLAVAAAVDKMRREGTVIERETPEVKEVSEKTIPTVKEKRKTEKKTAAIAISAAVILLVIALLITPSAVKLIRENMEANKPPVAEVPDEGNGAPVDDTAEDTPADTPDGGEGEADEPADAPDTPDTPDVPDDGADEPVTDPEPVDPPEENPNGSLDDTYLFPSDRVLLTRADLEGKTTKETNLLINEIYARHGKIFETKSIQDYFESKSWYTPVTKSYGQIESKFNETEWANVYFILEYQKGGNSSSDNTPANPDSGNTQPETPPQQDTPARPEPTDNTILFPSDTKLITREDLEGKNRSESYMLINEIYARHGKTFETKSIQDYFNSQKWYNPISESYSQAEGKFNDTEWANVKTIIEYQKEMGYRS